MWLEKALSLQGILVFYGILSRESNLRNVYPNTMSKFYL